MIHAGPWDDPLQLFSLIAKGSNSVLCLPSGLATVPLSSHILCAFGAVMVVSADHVAACFISEFKGGLQKAFFA